MSGIVRHTVSEQAPPISAIAAANFRTLLAGMRDRDAVRALGALVSIDQDSWEGIRARLADAGVPLAEFTDLARRLGLR